MDKIAVDRILLTEASDTISKIAGERDALTVENVILRDVLSLVKEGRIDPLDVHVKVAEYLEDPSKLQLVKLAGVYTINKQHFGTFEDSDVSSGSNAEEILYERIRDINS